MALPATIICGLTLAVLSWTPAKYMVRTGVLTRHQEHFLAYLFQALSSPLSGRGIPLALV